MQSFLDAWHEAARTSAGFFWMALWAFALGYLISSLIQVLVTRARMQAAMGRAGAKSMALGSFFGFISSSCSFAALSTTRAIFQKGAGLAPALAFLLASTNLVIELGIVITIFLSWQFVVGEYVGGVLLILFAWLFVRVTRPDRMVERVRERLGEDGDGQDHGGQTPNWREKVRTLEGWEKIGQTYVMEWQMVWKDVLIGFAVAGAISAFVPQTFFETLFVGSGQGAGAELSFLDVVAQTLIGPVAAFFTFIGSMGNIPLAGLLYENGVSFAGVMAFIFSDLVVLPVLRINASYYGWRMALYILALLLSGLVVVSLVMHYTLLGLNLLPQGGMFAGAGEREFFAFDYSFVLNVLFLAASVVLGVLWWRARSGSHHDHDHGGGSSWTDRILRTLALFALVWLIVGLVILPLL